MKSLDEKLKNNLANYPGASFEMKILNSLVDNIWNSFYDAGHTNAINSLASNLTQSINDLRNKE